MKLSAKNRSKLSVNRWPTMALSTAILLATSGTAGADEADARRLLKAMTDYMTSQEAISFSYDATLEVVTAEDQVLGLASSGQVSINRPNKIRATRSGGFVDVEMNFDGTTMTIFGKNANAYTQFEAPGNLDQLVDVMKNQHGMPLPAADLILSNAYEALTADVIDVKDLGSGVIDGMECDSLAFRTEEVDWQIWIAHGDRPYPCRFTITSKTVIGSPQYSIQPGNWQTGDAAAATDFTFKNTTDATKIEISEFDRGFLPDNFKLGESQ